MTVSGGFRSVTLYDTVATSWTDLSSQFYLKKADIGKNRAEVSHQQLTELNPYTTVDKHTQPLTQEFIKEKFQVVVIADRLALGPLSVLFQLADFCHENNICFIVAETRGVFSRLFCDFGEAFVVNDVNGEPVVSAMIASVTSEENGVVTCLDESRHGLEDGDYVTFQEVSGMEELNGCPPIQIKVTGPYTFTIGDTRGKEGLSLISNLKSKLI